MMGFLTGALSGSSTSHESSNGYNQAYNYLNGALSPSVSAGAGATNALASNLLGTTSPGSNPAFQNYQNNTGYQWQVGQGTQALQNSAAAQGLLNSGATLKAIDQYGQNAGLSSYQNYLSNLSGLAGQGQSAAGIIGNAGQVTSSSKNTGQGLGSIFGMF
jgi:hypothetical protein